MALSLTCKAHALDELSLILLIENELTRCHGVQTIKKATSLWRKVYRNSLLKRWMNRNDTTTDEPIRVTRQMLSETVYHCFEVMFHKMLRAVPEFECLRMVSDPGDNGWPLIHSVVSSGNSEAIRAILDHCPESERSQVATFQDNYLNRTVLHCAAESGNIECIKLILSYHPESEYSRAVRSQDKMGATVLHCVARSGNLECIKLVLDHYPESERLQAVSTQGTNGETVLHMVARSGNCESLEAILALYPKAQHLQVEGPYCIMLPVQTILSVSTRF